jgi:membrane peptidoglycan carboxypeptidase
VYATIDDGGYRNKQITITRVVLPDGRVDSSWGRPSRTRVLSSAAAAVETEILQHNVEYGTATRAAIDCPSAAKTGTTSNLVDAWLDGYTPERTTVVWMGYPKADVSMNDVHGQAQYGGDLPAQIWRDFMASVVNPPCASFVSPTTDPMTYLPFSGHYQQLGFASYVPSTGATGASKKAGAGAGAGGTTAPAGTGTGGAGAGGAGAQLGAGGPQLSTGGAQPTPAVGAT